LKWLCGFGAPKRYALTFTTYLVISRCSAVGERVVTIRASRGRRLVMMADRPNLFTDAQQETFLSHFAATCNLRQSAVVAGVRRTVIYDRLEHDPAFAGAFHVAEETGVQNLRAELVRRSLALLQATTPDEAALASLPGLDCGFILNLLKQHERALGQESGDRRPRRSDAKEAAARLAKLMDRMREEHKRELAAKRKAKASARAPRSTASVEGRSVLAR
jgi:hypothetical protein